LFGKSIPYLAICPLTNRNTNKTFNAHMDSKPMDHFLLAFDG
jgi:hypothetical protein